MSAAVDEPTVDVDLAEDEDEVGRPRDWDKAVAAAYLLALGRTQEEAAKGAGVGERSLHRWVGCSWWSKAVDEAASRWLNDARTGARRTLLLAGLKGANGDANLALRVLERTEPALPPKQRHELTGSEGGPIEFARRIKEALEEIEAADGAD